jgi:2-(1,2-epoxy-1,2-dihydrophenyl)acetyl-CoA isomerase
VFIHQAPVRSDCCGNADASQQLPRDKGMVPAMTTLDPYQVTEFSPSLQRDTHSCAACGVPAAASGCRRDKFRQEHAMDQEILTRIENGVAVVTLNRPDRLNALSPAMITGLTAVLAGVAVDPDVGCVVLTGAGRGFCAGGDVQVQAAAATQATPALSAEARADRLRAAMEAGRLLHEMAKPTIAMVNGVAAGAGLSLALACDLRLIGQSARMTTAFAKVGLSGDFGGSFFLTRLLGPARTRELYFTAEMLNAERIVALGLAGQVFADDRLETETMALAARLAAGPRVAWRYMKRNFKVAEEGTLSALLDSETFGMMRCRETEDHREAARAFVEKRPPVFRGR